jgi:hypothetical protein
MRGDWDVSIRRACRVFLVDTSTYHYKSRRPGQAALEQRIKEICQTPGYIRPLSMTTRSPHLILPSSMCEAYNRVYEQLYGSR